MNDFDPFEEWWETVKAKPGVGTRESYRQAWDAATEHAATTAETTTVFVGDFGQPDRAKFAVENMRRLAEAITSRIRERKT